MVEKSDDIGLNEVIAPKNKQGSYGSRGYLHNLKLSIDPLVWNLISSIVTMARLRVETKPGISISKKSLLVIFQ